MDNYDKLIQSAMVEVDSSTSLDQLENIRIKYFGKNGIINQELKLISKLSDEEKRLKGTELNKFKSSFFTTCQPLFLSKTTLLIRCSELLRSHGMCRLCGVSSVLKLR